MACPAAAALLAALTMTLAAPLAASATPYGPVAWGANDFGQLGDGNQLESNVPIAVTGLKGVAAIAGGAYHSLALLKAGTAMAWGDNEYGQLGNGNDVGSDVPVEVKGLKEVAAVAAGAVHSLALLKDGTVMAWGDNEYGQLGDGTRTTSDRPVEVKGLKEVTAIAAGGAHSLALLKDGTVMAWGYNVYGQLGDGNEIASSVPVKVAGLTEVMAIAGGKDHSLALLKDGVVMAWGYNEYGQLGDGYYLDSNAPVEVKGLPDSRLRRPEAIAAGSVHSVVLLTDGTVMDWGDNDYGQLGDGTYNTNNHPVEVKGLKGVTAIAAGGVHNLALVRGEAVSWGANESGQLGGEIETDSNVPVEVIGLTEVAALAGGSRYSLALTTVGPAPTVTGLSVKKGPATGGTLVTITGTGFTNGSAVHFGPGEASIRSRTETSLIVESPPGSRAVYVTVTTPNGTSPASGKAAKPAKFKYKRVHPAS